MDVLPIMTLPGFLDPRMTLSLCTVLPLLSKSPRIRSASYCWKISRLEVSVALFCWGFQHYDVWISVDRDQRSTILVYSSDFPSLVDVVTEI